jgi:hypothetical protein
MREMEHFVGLELTGVGVSKVLREVQPLYHFVRHKSHKAGFRVTNFFTD